MPRVQVQIVTWNSLAYIRDCMDALAQQTFTDFTVVVIDNDSQDQTVAFLREHYPTITVLQNFKNQGFARAHNQGIQYAKTEYVLVLNPDVVLSPSFLERVIESADRQPKAASIGGKMLRLTSDATVGDDGEAFCTLQRSQIIDSTGLLIHKNRHVTERGANQTDQGQYDKSGEVFGVSGACVLYRVEALREVAILNEFFDVSFFAYKEDIDLAWRLQLYGWSAYYCAAAIGYHVRHFAASGQRTVGALAKSRRDISRRIKAYSLRNHYCTIIKNDHLQNMILHAPRILVREFARVGYCLLFEPYQWRTFGEVMRLLPKMLVKRAIIKQHCNRTAKDMRKWFV